MAGHGHNLKNADGTVNFEGLQGHVSDLKAKYANNAANFERNTGKPFETGHSTSGSQSTDNAIGEDYKKSNAQGHGEVGQTRGSADYDGPEGFANAAQPTGQSGHEKAGSVSKEGHGSHY